ncbi:hypothetical protein DPMN_068499 [Dreissena polymorpha]|uniref:Uncharacterized protein n=1 Tax=Dreissena polymorpha TaxID=45954 RepID=A0A9D4BU95_DREPO|nr:hypothetical protein DPMN_068499 [Dreissena polymorpha]
MSDGKTEDVLQLHGHPGRHSQPGHVYQGLQHADPLRGSQRPSFLHWNSRAFP